MYLLGFIFQTLRYLENSYDKTKLKMDEATHLYRIYQDINRKLCVVSFKKCLPTFNEMVIG